MTSTKPTVWRAAMLALGAYDPARDFAPISQVLVIEDVAAAGDDHCHLTAHQVGGEIRQPVVAIFRPAIFNQHIPTLGIADDFAQALSEYGRQMCK